MSCSAKKKKRNLCSLCHTHTEKKKAKQAYCGCSFFFFDYYFNDCCAISSLHAQAKKKKKARLTKKKRYMIERRGGNRKKGYRFELRNVKQDHESERLFVCYYYSFVDVTTPASSTWCCSPGPRLKGEAKSQPASLSCDVGLLVASANRSRVESCSGGLELVQCPHYPYRAYTRPRVVLTLIKSCKHARGRQNNSTRLKKKKRVPLWLRIVFALSQNDDRRHRTPLCVQTELRALLWKERMRSCFGSSRRKKKINK